MYQLDLNTIAGGALAEKLAIEFQRVAQNIADPNTKAEAVRSVTVVIKIKPDETREIAVSEINCSSKIAPAKGIPTKFIIDQDNNGQAVIAELASGTKNQMMIDLDGDLADDRGNKVQAETAQNDKVVAFR